MNTAINPLLTIRRAGLASVLLAAGVCAGLPPLAAAAPESGATVTLEQGFSNPPAQARPRVWWHWMNGNISKEGIRADLDWMSRIGIGGLQNFDAALNTPQIVDERLVYMTPGWQEAFRYAAEQADERNLELAIAGSPGWSETGGPWVAPEDGMKKVVWSAIDIAGGEPFNGSLPPLPQASGAFQDIDGHGSASLSAADHDVPTLVRDTLVLAYPTKGEGAQLPQPQFSRDDGEVLDAALLGDGHYTDAVKVPRGKPEQAPPAINIEFDAPATVSALTVHIPSAAGVFGGPSLAPVLEVAADDGAWRKLADVVLSEVPTTVSFPGLSARQFRLVLAPSNAKSLLGAMGTPSAGVDALSMMAVFAAPGEEGGSNETMAALAGMGRDHEVTELAFHTSPRVSQFEQKAGFSVAEDYYALSATPVSAEDSVSPDQVVNLTDRLQDDGRLDWTPPAGNWRVIRFGYSLTGKTNHPAPPEATGLEVDKYDGEAVRRYMETYLGNYRKAAGKDLVGDRGLRALLTDSIEVGPSNWTPKIVEQFKRLRGYDPTPWLPALTGVVVGSGAQSDAFLYDYRRTLADLIASEHYGVIADVTEQWGLTYYSEALESIRPVLGDELAMRAHADVPMAAMWTYGQAGPNPGYLNDMRGAASVAHIYGQNIAATESLTSVLQPWSHSPAMLRPVMDLIFSQGINRPVIHTSVHQPADERFPGLALLIFGQYFNRHETWADMAKPWVDYMSRSSFLLQQGRGFADVAYFYGEEGPVNMQYKEGLPPDAPTRYGFDFINSDALRDVVSVQGNELVTTGGARYRVLYLGGNSHFMTLPTLRRIGELVEQGATVVGSAPRATPSLADDAKAFDALVKRLWGDGSGGTVGKGRVIVSDDVEAVLAGLGYAPDLSHGTNAQVLFQHRRLADGDIYFLTNRTAEDASGEYRFRVSGKAPELWRADTGEQRPLSYRMDEDVTVVDLTVAPEDAFFVVFRNDTDQREATVAAPAWNTVAQIGDGPWQVGFQPGRGAPAGATLAALQPLNEHDNPDIRYFSGVSSYAKTFTLPKGVNPGDALLLDLGDIADVAEVYINGEMAGTAWRAPYRVEIGHLVREGANELEVRVANLWVNRLIGDVQPDATPITWTSTKIYLPSAPLRPAGLLGPVSLLAPQ